MNDFSSKQSNQISIAKFVWFERKWEEGKMWEKQWEEISKEVRNRINYVHHLTWDKEKRKRREKRVEFSSPWSGWIEKWEEKNYVLLEWQKCPWTK